MAETITFSYKFIGSSEIPAIIQYNNVLKEQFYPWASVNLENYHFDTIRNYSIEGAIETIRGQENEVTVAPVEDLPSPIIFDDIYQIGRLTYSDLRALIPNANDTVNVYTIRLGEDSLHNYVELKLDLMCRANGTLSSDYMYTYYLHFGQEGSQTHLDRVIGRSNFYLHSDASGANLIKFGLPLIHIPGREDTITNSIMAPIHCTELAGTTHNTFQIVKTRTYIPSQPIAWDYNMISSHTGTGWRDEMFYPIDMAKLLDELNMEMPIDYSSEEAGDPSEPGGYHAGDLGDPGNFDDSSDTVSVPSLPSIGVSNVGFVNVYKVTSGGLVNMGKELFPALQYTQPAQISGTDVVDTLINGFNAIMTFMANVPSFFDQINAATFINYILDCHIIPVTPSGGTSEAIKVGSKTLNSTGDKLSSDYIEVDCGTLSLKEYYANFADFLTSFKLYLPFVGMVSSRPEWFYRESLQVVYHFNIVDGSFMAYILSTGAYVNNNNSGKTIVGQYGGNCCVHIPITGVTYSSMVSGLVGAGSGAVMAAGSGNIPALTTSAIAAAAAHGDIAQSNAYASSVAFLGCRRPFAVIERPVSSFSEKYAIEKGIPSNVARKLGNVTGFSMIGDVHLDGIDATEAEKLEIERLLHEGVIL